MCLLGTMSTKPSLSPRLPVLVGAAACAACCAFPVAAVAVGLGAGTATTITAFLEPIGAGLLAAGAMFAAGLYVWRRRAKRREVRACAADRSCGCGPGARATD